MAHKLFLSREIKILWVKDVLPTIPHLETSLLQPGCFKVSFTFREIPVCLESVSFMWLLVKLTFIYENIVKTSSVYIFFALIMHWLMISYNKGSMVILNRHYYTKSFQKPVQKNWRKPMRPFETITKPFHTQHLQC